MPAKNVTETGNNYPVLRGKIVASVAEFARNAAEVKRLTALNDALRPLILAAVGDAPIACAGHHVVRVTVVPDVPPDAPRLIVKADVGKPYPSKPGRKGYVRLEVV